MADTDPLDVEEGKPSAEKHRSASNKNDSHTSPNRMMGFKWADSSSFSSFTDKAAVFKQFEPLSYVTNYIPTLKKTEDTSELVQKQKEENLAKLRSYYQKEALEALASRKSSHVSQISNSPRPKSAKSRLIYNPRFSASSFDRSSEEHKSSQSDKSQTGIEQQASEAAKVYKKYRQKFSPDFISHTDKDRDENMWLPVAKWNPLDSGEEPKLYTSYKMRLDVPFSDTCPITLSKLYPPVFSETKVPALTFHSIVHLNNCLYIFGGMSPSYQYSDFAPDLSSLHMDGIKNLPPPLDEGVINNPAMIPSNKLYTYSYCSSKWTELEATGQVPPPLVCVQGSVLTDRHIFYYGGFEIKHEVAIDPKTNEYYLKRRAVLNDTAYILDTLCYKFAKIELVAQPTKYVKFPNTVPRFGHLQVSLKTNANNTTKNTSSGVDSTPSSSTTSSSSIEKSSSSNTSEDPIMNLVSSSMTLNSDTIISPTSASTPGVYSILIMGGYRDGENGEFEPISDLWKVEVTVLSRGKNNFMKFADTALVTIISSLPQNSVDDALKKEYYKKWPLPRGFMAFYVADTDALHPRSLEEDILEKLMHKFRIIDSSAEKPVIHEKGTPVRYPAPNPKSKRLNKSLIIHGGSANGFIHGDMWCYDLDEGTWSKIALKNKDKDSGEMKVVEFPLVGHSLINHKQVTIIIGGMNQTDVDNNPCYKQRDKTEARSCPLQDTTGFFTFISLPSWQIKSFPVDQISRTNEGKFSEDMLLSAMRLSCNPIVYDEDYIWTVGGLIRDTGNSSAYLRGAISLVTLPMIDIPGG